MPCADASHAHHRNASTVRARETRYPTNTAQGTGMSESGAMTIARGGG